MQTLENRLCRLETAAHPRGPLLISWVLDGNERARAAHEGCTYTQAADEDRQRFMHRVASNVPQRAVVWVDQLDATL